MTKAFRLTLAQLNPTMGDLAGNAARIETAWAKAKAEGAELLLCAELALSGYPPEDLVQKPAFVAACMAAAEKLAADCADGPPLIFGTPWQEPGQLPTNALVLAEAGRITDRIDKRRLPNYGVFDEARTFRSGRPRGCVTVAGRRLGVMVCEDMWFPEVAADLARDGAEILLVANGSPFEHDKPQHRLSHARARAAETGLPLVYLNQVGGQDELVFDGGSFAIAADGAVMHALTRFEESVRTLAVGEASEPAPALDDLAAIWLALVLGLRDYVNKNGFPGVVFGLSGGIDSALVAAIAVDALGPERVRAVMMPSPYTSAESLMDAAECARLLGIHLDTVPISQAMHSFDAMLAPLFAATSPDTTEENIQSRIRGQILMAISNKFGPMVVSTGNKSEMSVGYATIYGDMCGGYAVLKDVYKTTVFALSRWRNHISPVMPERVITKPPSAELKPNQTDQDSLPPYDELDAILKCLIEAELGVAETVARGFDAATVGRIQRLLDRAEYKRRQAPPGVKITSRAFGRDRRYPITNRFRQGGPAGG